MKNDDPTIYHQVLTQPVDGTHTVPGNNATVAGNHTVLGTTMENYAGSDPIADVPIEKGNTILNLYKVESDPIVGGMGRIFRVHHTSWNVDLAMKQPKRELFRNEKQKADFIKECEHWINLGLHPHIVSCYYIREIDDIPSIFSEWMDGGSLKGFIESGALYDGSDEAVLERILDIAIQFARGLHYAHEQGLIHQDVKPDNLLLTKSGEAKVADFGIANARAKVAETNTDSSGSRTIVSQGNAYTPAYCSPEQVRREELTHRTDIWSWAVSMLEMFMGDRQWHDGTVAGRVCEEYFGTERITIPEAMKDLLRHCFKENEADRPHDFKEVESELLHIYQAVIGNTYTRIEPKAASDTADSLNNKALSYLDMGQPEKAEECWEKALISDPGHVVSLYNRSVYLWKNGKIDDAEVIRLLASNTAIKSNYYLALVHIARGDAESAIEGLNKAIEAEGETEDIKEALSTANRMAEDGKDWKCISTFEYLWNYLMSACFSPDGSKILSGSAYIILLDIATKESIQSFKIYNDTVQEVCFSPDQSKILSGGSYDGVMRLWDLATEKCICTFEGHSDIVSSICFSPDGKKALSGCRDNTIKLWDTTTGRCIRTFEEYVNYPHSVCFSPDGNKAISGDFDHKIKLWDINTGICIRTFEGHTDYVQSVCFSSDGNKILSGSVYTMKLWDIITGECIRTFKTSGSFAVCFSPDNCRALSGGREGSSAMQLWDMNTGICIHSFEGYKDFVKVVCFSPDGKQILGSSSNTIKIWDVPDIIDNADHIRMVLSHIHSTEISVKNEELFSALADDIDDLIVDGKIQLALYKLDELKKLRIFGNNQIYNSIIKKLSAYCILNSILNQTTQILEQDSAKRLYHHSCSFNTNGSKVISAGYRSVSLWNVATGQLIKIFETQAYHFIKSVCFSPGESNVFSVGIDKEVVLWDMETDERIRSFEGHTDDINSVCFSPDGSKILSGSGDKTLKLWDVAGRNCIHTFEGHVHGVTEVCFHPDGSKILSASSDETIKIWDIATGNCIRTFIPASVHTDINSAYTYSACFSSDGQRILTGGGFDHVIKIWDMVSGECIHTLEKDKRGFVRFSPDGNKALTGNGENIKMWDTVTGECIYTFKGHMDYVDSFNFSPDGLKIASTSDRGIFIYDLEYDLSFPGWTDWDEGARPYLEIFLTLHPDWTDKDFNNILIPDLQNRGYGWLRLEGVRAKLNEMNGAPSGQSPPVYPENVSQETQMQPEPISQNTKQSFWKRLVKPNLNNNNK